jgi:steroid 5-alpha reductase family enzyme
MGNVYLNPSRGAALLWVAAVYFVALCIAYATTRAFPRLDPLFMAGVADLAATVVVFGFSMVLNNSSIYDPYWSVAPIPIAIFWAWVGLDSTASLVRTVLVLTLVGLWGVRLTLNWVRRWQGLADEDFRYVTIRHKTGRAYWLASLVTIHLMPTLWVFAGLLPLYAALSPQSERPFGALDVVATVVTLAAIIVETVADRQLRRFMSTLREPSAVLDTGLWAISRHPNYLGEVLFWWGIYLFGLAANPSWWWTVVGALSITGLFVFVSVPWMDRRMALGHPSYAARLKNTPALFPWPRARS